MYFQIFNKPLIKRTFFFAFIAALFCLCVGNSVAALHSSRRAVLEDRAKVVYLRGHHDFTIAHLNISGGSNACITLVNCYNVRIFQNKLYNSTDVGIRLCNCKNVHIFNNYFTNLSTGVYAERSDGGGIQVDHNQLLNMQGPYPRGQFVQFNQINGPGNLISYNRCENIEGRSKPEDGISLYKCNGTQKSKILIKGNWIRGGGPSRSGGGIMLGDNGGSYQIALGNILIDPGQYGIAISGGDHNSIVTNSIYARPQYFTNVGVYVAGYNGTACTHITVAGNKVRFYNSNKSLNNFWLGPGVQVPAGWTSNSWNAKIDARLLPATIIAAN